MYTYMHTYMHAYLYTYIYIYILYIYIYIYMYIYKHTHKLRKELVAFAHTTDSNFEVFSMNLDELVNIKQERR
jgi:hypothetical protein